MLKLWQSFLFFLLCLLIGLVLNLPVQNALTYVELPRNIRAAGIDGTLLKGRAAEIVVNDIPARDIRYRYLPSCLPMLKICYRISYAQGETQIAYDTLNGDTEITKTRLVYSAAEVAHYMQNFPVRPDGTLELTVAEMTMIDGIPAAVSGKLLWRDLGINDDGIKLNIGDYLFEFSGNPQGYEFKMNDLDASLEVSGDGEIEASGAFKVDLRIKSDDTIEPQVKSVLELVAAKTGFNQYRVEQSGRLPANLRRRLFK